MKSKLRKQAESRYECYGCKSGHSTENMVAYCASCFEAARQLADPREKYTEALYNFRTELRGLNGKLESERKRREEIEYVLECVEKSRNDVEAKLEQSESGAAAMREALVELRECLRGNTTTAGYMSELLSRSAMALSSSTGKAYAEEMERLRNRVKELEAGK